MECFECGEEFDNKGDNYSMVGCDECGVVFKTKPLCEDCYGGYCSICQADEELQMLMDRDMGDS